MAEDSAGNVLGRRGTFEYTTDDGETVVYTGDLTVGLAVGNTLASASARPTSVNSKYLRGRYVLMQSEAEPEVKKKVIIGDPANALFAAVASSTRIINGVTYVSTGRVGEAVSFLRTTPLIDPE